MIVYFVFNVGAYFIEKWGCAAPTLLQKVVAILRGQTIEYQTLVM